MLMKTLVAAVITAMAGLAASLPAQAQDLPKTQLKVVGSATIAPFDFSLSVLVQNGTS